MVKAKEMAKWELAHLQDQFSMSSTRPTSRQSNPAQLHVLALKLNVWETMFAYLLRLFDVSAPSLTSAHRLKQIDITAGHPVSRPFAGEKSFPRLLARGSSQAIRFARQGQLCSW